MVHCCLYLDFDSERPQRAKKMADVGPGWGYFSAHLNPEKEDTVVYAWGGRGEEDDYMANGKFDLFLEAWEGTDWNAQGEPPNLFNGACAAIGPIIYFYGGRGEGKDAFSSALYQLDTTTMMWTKVADAVNPGPMRAGWWLSRISWSCLAVMAFRMTPLQMTALLKKAQRKAKGGPTSCTCLTLTKVEKCTCCK